MQNLKIAIVQTQLFWEDVDQNIKHFEQLLSDIQPVDMVVLPEMLTTGFSMNTKMLAKESTEKGLAFLKQQAKLHQTAIAGSLMFLEENKQLCYNTFVFAEPNGQLSFYDKRHLFSPGTEHLYYSKGKNKVIIEYKGWKICPQVCYDLRFPVFSRNQEHYDVLIYVANWPEKRNSAWEILLKARAIENQAFVIACNRIGVDGNQIPYIGNSAKIDYLGVSETLGQEEQIQYFELNHQELMAFRQTFPVLSDADDFLLK